MMSTSQARMVRESIIRKLILSIYKLQAKLRAIMTDEEKEIERKRNKDLQADKRARMTEEERKVAKEKQRLRMQKKRIEIKKKHSDEAIRKNEEASRPQFE